MASVSIPKITVNPSLTTTVDQKVDIIVSSLQPGQSITLRAQTTDDNKTVFEASAIYKADGNGEILVSSQPSLGGSYEGVEPMGLFWSMKPVMTCDRGDDLLRKRDATTPLKVTIDVCSGQDDSVKGKLEEQHRKATITLLRSFMGPGVTRYSVEENGIYGTLFLPAGDGPFPGIA